MSADYGDPSEKPGLCLFLGAEKPPLASRVSTQHHVEPKQEATSRSSIKPTFTLQFLTQRYRTSWGLFGKSVVLYPPSRDTGSVVKNEAMLPPLSSLASASVHVLLSTPKQQPPTTNGYDGASPNYLTATTTTGYPPKHHTILRIAAYYGELIGTLSLHQ